MASKKQLKANKKNAQASTGPRTPGGKAIVAQNAITHGLTALSPVIEGEQEEEWRDFRAGVFAHYAPHGCVEEALAEQIALILWRLRRIACFETGVINVGQEEKYGKFKKLDKKLKEAIQDRDLAQRRVESSTRSLGFFALLPTLADDAKVAGTDAHEVFKTAFVALDGLPEPGPNFANEMGLPPEAHQNTWSWDGWTAGHVRQLMGTLAARLKLTFEDVLAHCLRYQTELGQAQEERGREKQVLIEDLTCRRREMESRLRRKRMLPDEKTLAKMIRYEGHLGRQLRHALHELQRLQELRRGVKARARR